MAIFTAWIDLDAMDLPAPRQELADMLRRLARAVEDDGSSGLAFGDNLVTMHGDEVGHWSIGVMPTEPGQVVTSSPVPYIELSVRIPVGATNNRVNELMAQNRLSTPAEAWRQVIIETFGGWPTVTVLKDPSISWGGALPKRTRPRLEVTANDDMPPREMVTAAFAAVKADMVAQIDAVKDMPGMDRLINSARAMIARLDEMSPDVVPCCVCKVRPEDGLTGICAECQEEN